MSEPKPLFRTFHQEIWEQLATHLDESGEKWDGTKVTVQHGPFAVSLDLHAELAGYASRLVTRLRAAYINKDGFRFRLRRSDWLSDLAVMLGTQDIQLGDEAFDEAFVISANNEEKARFLLADPALRQALLESPADLVEVRDDEGDFGPAFPEEVDELYLHSRRRITVCSELEQLYGVFAELLNRLCHAGSAYEDDPHLQL
ncbi:MAG: DUF3137 domain-containing protein [Acidobacteriota bacterium]|nr:DUF3137 domain-containing protein [Acidobacteriota bacterium]MDQ7088986.1 DUF3137 domain-containing protein [Acidobacteriota bacterium]